MPAQIKIKRFDKDLPFPARQTDGAVAYDLCAREDTVIPAGEVRYVPLNVAIELPRGYWGMLAARSSTHKFGIMPVNGIGIFDGDFRGDGDEYKMAALNFTSKPVTVTRGARIGQFMAFRLADYQLVEVDSLEGANRGGFGTTGTH